MDNGRARTCRTLHKQALLSVLEEKLPNKQRRTVAKTSRWSTRTTTPTPPPVTRCKQVLQQQVLQHCDTAAIERHNRSVPFFLHFLCVLSVLPNRHCLFVGDKRKQFETCGTYSLASSLSVAVSFFGMFLPCDHRSRLDRLDYYQNSQLQVSLRCRELAVPGSVIQIACWQRAFYNACKTQPNVLHVSRPCCVLHGKHMPCTVTPRMA